MCSPVGWPGKVSESVRCSLHNVINNSDNINNQRWRHLRAAHACFDGWHTVHPLQMPHTRAGLKGIFLNNSIRQSAVHRPRTCCAHMLGCVLHSSYAHDAAHIHYSSPPLHAYMRMHIARHPAPGSMQRAAPLVPSSSSDQDGGLDLARASSNPTS